MKNLAVIFADGTEEIEALSVVDVLRRSKISCDIISISETLTCIGSHGIKVISDKIVSETDFSEYDGIVIPGGLTGAEYISKCKKVNETLIEFNKKNKLIASICASPALVLSPLKLTDGKNVTCYPANEFIETLNNANYTGNNVEIDGNLITANGPKSAIDFAIKICEYFNIQAKI